MKTQIWEHIASLSTEGFFITANIQSEDQFFPKNIESYIYNKLKAIKSHHITGRKFVFKEGEWRIYLTFFPTTEVVNEKYALKNKVVRQK